MTDNTTIIYVDEYTFNLWQTPLKLWLAPSMTLPMQNNWGKSICVKGGIDEVVGLRHYYIFIGRNNTDRFAHFLRRMVDDFKGLRAVVILDNLSIHRTKRVQEIFDASNKVKAFFLAPYTSRLNPIERFWQVLKRKWKNELVQHNMDKYTEERAVDTIVRRNK